MTILNKILTNIQDFFGNGHLFAGAHVFYGYGQRGPTLFQQIHKDFCLACVCFWWIKMNLQ